MTNQDKQGHNYVQDMIKADRKEIIDKLMRLFDSVISQINHSTPLDMVAYKRGIRKKVRRIVR